MPGYKGRFAPSPTGPLHAGSLVAALASWLDAKAHQGQWLVRIEDVDTVRCIPGVDRLILEQLAQLGLHPDTKPVYQSQRSALYQSALEQLMGELRTYPCVCSRQKVSKALSATGHHALRHQEQIYPGTCRYGIELSPNRNKHTPLSWRFMTGPFSPSHNMNNASATQVNWHDRHLGAQSQDVAHAVGDFILKRTDGLWAYQLAVVVDDGAQGITHVVRGQDLADNTARQILLQRALQLPTPSYLHVPLILDANGEKLSKQTKAAALQTSKPLDALNQAALGLGLNVQAHDLADWLASAVQQWQDKYP